MANIRIRIEKWFEGFALRIYRHRKKTIAILLVVIAAMISPIANITIDTSIEGFMHDDDPALLAYNAFRDQFGRDEVVIIAIEPANVFDVVFFKKLQRLHEELESKVPYIEDITSLINARNTRGEGHELIVEDFLEQWPQSPHELATLKQRALSNQMYQNLLISEDSRFTTIVIQTLSHSAIGLQTDVLEGFDDDAAVLAADASSPRPYLTDQENSEVIHAVRQIVANYRADDFRIYLAGSPVVTHFLKKSMMKDMRNFMLMSIATVAICLFMMFRRITGVVLPLIIVIFSLLCTLGIMAALGVPIKLPTQILPSFLLAVGVGTSVHILAIFFHRLRHTSDKRAAIAYALGHSGLAIVMTNLTTACGLMSFATAEIAPIADLGIFAGIGVLLAFIFTIVLLPALLAVVPVKIKPLDSLESKKTAMDCVLAGFSRFSTSHPHAILIVSGLIVVMAAISITKIRLSHHPLGWFPAENEIRLATEKIDEELRGTLSLEVIIDTGRENGLYDPAFLNRLEQAVTKVEAMQYQEVFAGKAWCLTTILKEINQALNENRSSHYRIPQNKDLIAQEFLLFENSGSDDLEDVVDSQFAMARFTIKAPFKDAVKYGIFLKDVQHYFQVNFPEVNLTLTGMMVLLVQTLNNAIISMAQSYLIALIVITILMIILIGKIRIGFLSMIPNLVPIIMMLGVIGALGLPLDLFTMMVASIAIGLAVDDTIHFMHNFRRYYEIGGDPKAAVFETLHTTGRAMLVTTVVLSIGFFIFAFATMSNIRNFGLLTGFTIVMALLADYLIAPALMVVVNKKIDTPVEGETS